MDQSITSVFALSSQCNAAVFAVRSTLFDACGTVGSSIFLPFSVQEQSAASRHINNVGLLDLMNLATTWHRAVDPIQLFPPRIALGLLADHLRHSRTRYLTELDTCGPILHSLYRQFLPEYTYPLPPHLAFDASAMLEVATRDCDHRQLIQELALLHTPQAYAIQT